MTAIPSIAGLRIMLVEDDALIVSLIAEILVEAHATVVGPFNRVPDALVAAQAAAIDVALLDVDVGGVAVFPVAEALSARAIPLVLLSGHGRSAVPRTHPEWAVCSKPFKAVELIAALAQAIRR